MTNSFFGDESVVSVSLDEWMSWASGKQNEQPHKHHVVLPMIQRGSVWAPHKLLDLWDTLLRGMPIGAMMASEADLKKQVKGIGETGARQAKASDISLIDGQQRTLSMLAGWPEGLVNPDRPVAIWVDLIDAPQGEYLFRLWATTRAQPYGYARASMGGQSLSKLERNKLRLANEAWEKSDALTLWKQPDFMPWEAKFALPLPKLIVNRDQLQAFVQDQLTRLKEALEKKVSSPNGSNDEISQQISKHFTEKLKTLPADSDLGKSIHSLKSALNNVLACKFPVIHVRRESFDDLGGQSEGENIDPPLAILFKRVGTGGEPLSNADYVYSVIKHHSDMVHGMVESLLDDQKIRAIYTPTTLVMSAVRLTILNLKYGDGKGQKIVDSAKLDKATFARLVRNHSGFIEEFEGAIKKGGTFVTSLRQVLDNLSYDGGGFKTGLPKHALCLIPIPLLETILAWHTLNNPTADAMERSRLPMVRFVLQGNLCVTDYPKASEVAIKALKDDKTVLDYAKTSGVDVGILKGDEFPDQVLLDLLTKGDKATAYSLPSPDRLKQTKDKFGYLLTGPSEDVKVDVKGLRGWSRFSLKEDAKREDKACAEVYKRWWNRKGGHVHPMLLWLQRDYVFVKFEQQPALAGMDEETPFDFDHILPSAQWAYWTGAEKGHRFIDYPLMDGNTIVDNTGHWHIGNSIGNIHVLESSENRSWGDASVIDKLGNGEFAKNALVRVDDKERCWLSASGDTEAPRVWKNPRALAFQRAVEQRAFDLYSKFYADLFPAK